MNIVWNESLFLWYFWTLIIHNIGAEHNPFIVLWTIMMKWVTWHEFLHINKWFVEFDALCIKARLYTHKIRNLCGVSIKIDLEILWIFTTRCFMFTYRTRIADFWDGVVDMLASHYSWKFELYEKHQKESGSNFNGNDHYTLLLRNKRVDLRENVISYFMIWNTEFFHLLR